MQYLPEGYSNLFLLGINRRQAIHFKQFYLPEGKCIFVDNTNDLRGYDPSDLLLISDAHLRRDFEEIVALATLLKFNICRMPIGYLYGFQGEYYSYKFKELIN